MILCQGRMYIIKYINPDSYTVVVRGVADLYP